MYIVFFGNMTAPVLQNTRDNTLFKGKAILLFGARKVGKTTLLTQWANSCHKPILEVSGEEPDIRELLSSITSTQLKNYIGHNPKNSYEFFARRADELQNSVKHHVMHKT